VEIGGLSRQIDLVFDPSPGDAFVVGPSTPENGALGLYISNLLFTDLPFDQFKQEYQTRPKGE